MLVIALTIFLTLFSFTFHELGHAYALWRCGVPVKRISLLGIPLKNLPPLFSVPVRLPWQPIPVTIEMHPLLFGAMVAPQEGGVNSLPLKDQLFFRFAGPLASLLYGTIMAYGAYLSHPSSYPSWWNIYLLVSMALMALLSRFICRYLLLGLGFFALAFTASLCLMNWHLFFALGGFQGPVQTVQGAAHAMIVGHRTGYELQAAFNVASWISFCVGLTNMLPISILDGGFAARAYLSRFSKYELMAYNAVSMALIAGMGGMALGGDIAALAKPVVVAYAVHQLEAQK